MECGIFKKTPDWEEPETICAPPYRDLSKHWIFNIHLIHTQSATMSEENTDISRELMGKINFVGDSDLFPHLASTRKGNIVYYQCFWSWKCYVCCSVIHRFWYWRTSLQLCRTAGDVLSWTFHCHRFLNGDLKPQIVSGYLLLLMKSKMTWLTGVKLKCVIYWAVTVRFIIFFNNGSTVPLITRLG